MKLHYVRSKLLPQLDHSSISLQLILVYRTQVTGSPNALNVKGMVDVLHWIPFHQHKIRSQAFLDLPSIRKAESLSWQVGRRRQSLHRCEVAFVYEDGQLVMDR